MGDWDAALSYATESLPFYDAYYAHIPNHPLLALQLVMHAKLAWLLQNPPMPSAAGDAHSPSLKSRMEHDMISFVR